MISTNDKCERLNFPSLLTIRRFFKGKDSPNLLHMSLGEFPTLPAAVDFDSRTVRSGVPYSSSTPPLKSQLQHIPNLKGDPFEEAYYV